MKNPHMKIEVNDMTISIESGKVNITYTDKDISDSDLRRIFVNDSLYESVYRDFFRKRDIRDMYFSKIYPKLSKKEQIDDIKEFIRIRLSKIENKRNSITVTDKVNCAKMCLDLDEISQIMCENFIPGGNKPRYEK